MKPILLSILISFFATTIFAQHFEIGFDVGHEYTKIRNKQQDYIYEPGLQSNFLTYGIKGMYLLKKWQFGFSTDYRRNTYSSVINMFYNGYFGPYSPTYAITSEHEIPLKIFVNRKIVFFRHLEIYGGAFIGYTYEKERVNVSEMQALDEQTSDTWLSIGLQAGISYFVTKHIGINVEASAERSDHGNVYNEFYYPATIGIRYRF